MQDGLTINSRRMKVVASSLVLTFIAFRLWLHHSPNTDLNIGQYNIHHLFMGILIVMLCGIPLVIFQGNGRLLDAAALGFGIGLSMALDEWVFLIATDGSNASYLLRVSLWGGAIMVGLSCAYLLALSLFRKEIRNKKEIAP